MSIDMNPAQQALVDILSTSDRVAPEAIHQLCQQLPAASDEEMAWFLHQLAEFGARAGRDQLWETILGGCEAWVRRRLDTDLEEPLPQNLISAVADLYSQLGSDVSARYHLLSMLTISGQPPELQQFCQLVSTDPPAGLAQATAPFFPLLQAHVRVERLFPALLDALESQHIAVAVLELSNQLTRLGRFPAHPAQSRKHQLIELLANLTCRLENLQSEALTGAAEDSPAQREKVGNSVSLAVALCDALGQIGDARAESPLTDLMQLKHRRLRVEGAAALARLGNPHGREALLNLAEEPSVRLRVIAYAEELGLESELDERYRSPVAIGEAELVTYLAEPTMMGVPPTMCELVNSRTLCWPGYDEPRNCFLFRFTYQAAEPDGSFSKFTNFGIAGPLVHAFHQQIDQLPTETVYALFAGWQATHEDILDYEITVADRLHPVLVDYVDRLQRNDYADIVPAIHGKFFGDEILAASCRSDEQEGSAVVDAQTIEFFADLDPSAAYCIYKGQRLLRAFNDSF